MWLFTVLDGLNLITHALIGLEQILVFKTVNHATATLVLDYI